MGSDSDEVIEQITYLLFIRRLDDLQSLAEKQAKYGRGALKAVFPDGVDDQGRSYRDYRWTQFKGLSTTSPPGTDPRT